MSGQNGLEGTAKRRVKRTYEVVENTNEQETGQQQEIIHKIKTSPSANITQSNTPPRKSRFNNEPVEVQKYKRLKKELYQLDRKIKKFGWDRIQVKIKMNII